jgi:feruloyl-CoA synthase
MRLHTRLRYAPAEVKLEERADGSLLLRSPQALKPHARAVGDWLLRWYERAPDRTFIAERKGDGWRRVSYRDALSDARRIGQALLNLGLNAEKPVAILSDNSVDHALLALGAMHVGVPVAPISPAYSLMSKDHAKLKQIFELLKPGLVFAEQEEKLAPALAAVGA